MQTKFELPELVLVSDTECGLGHRRRCGVVANEWEKRGGRCRWNAENVESPVVYFIDHYGISAVDVQFMEMNGGFVVRMDDFSRDLACDVLVNYNVGVLLYGYTKSKRQLLGPRYALIRDDIGNAIVSETTPVFDCDAVNRSLSPYIFAEEMASAKVIVCSAGVTAYEAMYLGKPTLLRLAADNQQLTYDGLIKGGWALPYSDKNLALFLADSCARRMYQSGRKLIDGYGAKRVVDAILEAYAKSSTAQTN